MQRKFLLLALIPIILVMGIIAISSPQQTVSRPAPAPDAQQAVQPRPQEIQLTCKGIARCFTGEVKRIVEGDTLDIGDLRIRLALSNTPERGEPGYGEAIAFTTSLCPVGSRALVDEDDGQREGSFNRTIAVVYCNAKNLNAELSINKHAVINTRFCSDSEFGNENWAILGGCKLASVAPVPQQPAPQPAPAPAPALPATKHIVINEVEANPSGLDAGNEWVELFNPLGEAVDLSGWRILTTHGVTKTYLIPQGTSIGPGAHLVIQFSSQFIDNENEQLILIDSAGNEVDRTLPINDDANDQRTWQRRSDGLDNDAGSDWIFKTSTRGVMN